MGAGFEIEGVEGAIRALVAARDGDEVYRAAAAAIDRGTDADRCKVAVADGGTLVVRATGTDGIVEAGRSLPIVNGPIGRAFETGRTCVIDDLRSVRSAAASSGDDGPEYRSLLCAPVGEVGVLVAAARLPAAFDGEDRALAERIAGYAAAALDRIEDAPDGSGVDRLEELASVLSHDLRNPLRVAEGYLELARESGDEEHFDRIESAHDRIDELIEQLVALARTGDRLGATEEVDLESAVERAWDNVATADATITADGGTLVADEQALSRLLENLFANAVEYGGDDVAVRVGSLDSGFYVEDDGPGIPPEERDRAFEWGYSSSEEHPGIGLSIVDRLAGAHGWTVTATESDGGGARFEITGVEEAPPTGD